MLHLFRSHHFVFIQNFDSIEAKIVFAACLMIKAEAVLVFREIMGKRFVPKWTRPKLPVPTVRMSVKSFKL